MGRSKRLLGEFLVFVKHGAAVEGIAAKFSHDPHPKSSRSYQELEDHQPECH